jgi:hypothetical protein
MVQNPFKKLIVRQPLSKSLPFCETRRLITAFTRSIIGPDPAPSCSSSRQILMLSFNYAKVFQVVSSLEVNYNFVRISHFSHARYMP